MISKYITEDGVELPVRDARELLDLVTTGRIAAETMVFDAEGQAWRRAGNHAASRAALELHAASSSLSHGTPSSAPRQPGATAPPHPPTGQRMPRRATAAELFLEEPQAATAIGTSAGSRPGADAQPPDSLPVDPFSDKFEWYCAGGELEPEGPLSSIQVRRLIASGTLKGQAEIWRRSDGARIPVTSFQWPWKEWYYRSGSRLLGPFSTSFMRQAFISGELPLATPLWTPSMTEWKSARTLGFTPSGGVPTRSSSAGALIHGEVVASEMTPAAIMLSALGMAAAIVVADGVAGAAAARDPSAVGPILAFALTGLGAAFGALTYRNAKSAFFAVIAGIVTLMVGRAILAAAFMSSVAAEAVRDSLVEGSIVGAIGLLCGFAIWRVSQGRVFAVALDIRRDQLGSGKKKVDIGTCSNCGKDTRVAVERAINFLGKSEKYWCEHCRAFIRGNPAQMAVWGIAEIALGLTALVFVAALQPDRRPGRSSPSSSLPLLLVLAGVLDGFRRLIAGVRGAWRGMRTYPHSSPRQ